MLPAAHLPFPPPDWYRDGDFDPYKGKRVPKVWPWPDERPVHVETPPEPPAPMPRVH